MDAAELALWAEDYQDQPWDLRSIAEQLAFLSAAFLNVHRKKRAKAVDLEDLLPGAAKKQGHKPETHEDRGKRLKKMLGMFVDRKKKDPA